MHPVTARYLKQVKKGERVLAEVLLDIRLQANLSLYHVSRLSGIKQQNLYYWERQALTVPIWVYRLYRFYAAVSREYGPLFYIERVDPVTDPEIIAWVKTKGGWLHPPRNLMPARTLLLRRRTRLMREKISRMEEVLAYSGQGQEEQSAASG